MSHKTKDERRSEAKKRAAQYAELTPNQRWMHATNPHRPGAKRREQARILRSNPKLAKLVTEHAS